MFSRQKRRTATGASGWRFFFFKRNSPRVRRNPRRVANPETRRGEARLGTQRAGVGRASRRRSRARSRAATRPAPPRVVQNFASRATFAFAHLDLLGHRLDLVLRVRHPDQVAVRHQVEGVARRAHLLVHLVPAADGGVVVRVEHALVRPGILRAVQAVLGLVRERDAREAEQRRGRRPHRGEPLTGGPAGLGRGARRGGTRGGGRRGPSRAGGLSGEAEHRDARLATERPLPCARRCDDRARGCGPSAVTHTQRRQTQRGCAKKNLARIRGQPRSIRNRARTNERTFPMKFHRRHLSRSSGRAIREPAHSWRENRARSPTRPRAARPRVARRRRALSDPNKTFHRSID